MDLPENFDVVLFHCVTHAMKAEKVLKAAGLTIKLIPVPKHISSDCGVCLRFPHDQKQSVAATLEGQVEVREIRPLC